MSASPGSTAAAGLRRRLELVHGWYARMVDADTGRLEYLYLPEPDEFVRERSVIRDIASVWHIEMLEGFLGRDELRPVAATSLRHYCGNVAERDGHAIPDSGIVQCTRDGAPRERGGFGMSLNERAQRIDVTGHAASAFMKCIEAGVACRSQRFDVRRLPLAVPPPYAAATRWP